MTRVDDLHVFDLESQQWHEIEEFSGHPPTARHSHSAVRWRDGLYIFGGYDGSYRSDFHEFNFTTMKWSQVEMCFSKRIVNCTALYCVVVCTVFWVNFVYLFWCSRRTIAQISASGDVPRARYRGTCVVFENVMILHGGHDGSRHLQDTHIFDFVTKTWSALETTGNFELVLLDDPLRIQYLKPYIQSRYTSSWNNHILNLPYIGYLLAT